MAKSSKNTTRQSGTIVSITSVGEAGGVPLDGALLESATLEEAVERAIGQMDWLKSTDRAMVELALSYARQIDMANTLAVAAAEVLKDPERLAEEAGLLALEGMVKQANDAISKSMKAHYLGPHLHNALKALGGDPVARAEVTGAGPESKEQPANPLAEARARAKKRRGA